MLKERETSSGKRSLKRERFSFFLTCILFDKRLKIFNGWNISIASAKPNDGLSERESSQSPLVRDSFHSLWPPHRKTNVGVLQLLPTYVMQTFSLLTRT